MSVISDRKYAVDIDNDQFTDYYEPDILLTYDYSPFGVTLKERSLEKNICSDNPNYEPPTLIEGGAPAIDNTSWNGWGGTRYNPPLPHEK